MYVPATEKTPPNPYLTIPNRDIPLAEHQSLTTVNPAYMTRQLSEIAMEKEGVRFHITSLNPLRPENKPTDRETAYLKSFEQEGAADVGLFLDNGGRNTYFYMAPLVTTESCLSCHRSQGYKKGDIRGGISITLPHTMEIPVHSLVLGHVGVGVLGILGIIVSGIRLNAAYSTIKRQAVFDALTGIPNRRSFSERVIFEFRRSIRSGEPISVIMCDVDYFKSYNDIYGHAGGDVCLQKIAKGIEASLRRPGDFCARYGGEEFVVVLSNTDKPGALHVAERIRSHIEGLAIAHKGVPSGNIVTISLGVATSGKTPAASYEELVRQADTALYDAKHQGRNRVCSL